MEKEDSTVLQAKLERIGKLETEHRIIGISFAVREGVTVFTDEAADYVISAIEAGVDHLKNIAAIPVATFGPCETASAEPSALQFNI